MYIVEHVCPLWCDHRCSAGSAMNYLRNDLCEKVKYKQESTCSFERSRSRKMESNLNSEFLSNGVKDSCDCN
jgi:hypothetical protein